MELKQTQTKYRYASFPGYLTFAYVIGECSAALGVVAAFWHVSWVAGLLIIISSLVGIGIYFMYSRQLQKDNTPEKNEPGQ